MAEKKYKVAKDVALTAKGVIYKPGDVLPEDLLDKKQKEGKHYYVAISHAAKKLVRLIYAMEISGRPYFKVA